jgi:uncharacterized protein (DUF2147 family)
MRNVIVVSGLLALTLPSWLRTASAQTAVPAAPQPQLQVQPQPRPPGATPAPPARPGNPVAAAPAAVPSHRGQWFTEGGKSRVEVGDCGPQICATIVWLKEPNDEKGKPLHDGYNKRAQLRSRPILGLPLFEGMRPNGKGWIGKVYDPEEGDQYDDVSVWQSAPDTLSIKGCVLFICQTHAWQRAPAIGLPAAAAAPTGPLAPRR